MAGFGGYTADAIWTHLPECRSLLHTEVRRGCGSSFSSLELFVERCLTWPACRPFVAGLSLTADAALQPSPPNPSATLLPHCRLSLLARCRHP